VTGEIRILSTHAVLEVLHALAPDFERQSTHRLTVAYDPTAVIKREVETGAAFDIAIITTAAIEALCAQGKILHDSLKQIGRCGLGLSVRQGAPKPDISSADGFKRTLLAAKSIARSRDGASGQYFATVLARLGLTEALRDKIIIGPGGRIAELVARGEAEMAVQQVPELLPVQGAEFVGPFPTELQLYTDFAAGVASASKVGDAARALVDLLAAPSSALVFTAKGLEPVRR
jgi:molybdate transport system substrate-binding protein